MLIGMTDNPPRREDYEDIRDFLRDHEAYWNSTKPTKLAVLQRAARLGNDSMMAIEMQLNRVSDGSTQDDDGGFSGVFIDIDFLIAALWRMRQSGVLAKSAAGRWWIPLDDFDRALPDLKLMRDVSQHLAEYGVDGSGRRHINPRTGERVGRRALEVKSLGEDFGWLGGSLNLERADAASRTLLGEIRTVRDIAARDANDR